MMHILKKTAFLFRQARAAKRTRPYVSSVHPVRTGLQNVLESVCSRHGASVLVRAPSLRVYALCTLVLLLSLTGLWTGYQTLFSSAFAHALTRDPVFSRTVRAQEVDFFQDMTLQDAQNILPPPSLERRDGETIVWQYAGNGCVLDLYFRAPTSQVQPPHILHHEFRHPLTGNPASAACLGKLLTPSTPPHPLRLAQAE